MAEIIDTPLTRMKKKHDAEIGRKEEEIAALKLETAKVRGVHDLLKLELLALETQLSSMLEHVLTLKKGLE